MGTACFRDTAGIHVMPGYGAWTPQSPIQSLHFETVLARYECPTRPDIGTMLTDHGVIVSPRGQYAALCISNFKFQISNFKSQISNLKSQISNLKFISGCWH